MENTKICQCCGMPLNDENIISREPDGTLNDEYCKWCYTDGKFTYTSKEPLLDFIVGHMPNPDNKPDDVRRAEFDSYLSQLNYWKEA